MTHEKKYEIYREIEHEFLIGDAENHLLDYLGLDYGNVPSDVLEKLVEWFSNDKDCNVADNVTWQNVVEVYVETHKNVIQSLKGGC